jgi:hypothetical protein
MRLRVKARLFWNHVCAPLARAYPAFTALVALICFVVIGLGILVLTDFWTFHRMSAQDHLHSAKSALAANNTSEALRQVSAIPLSAKESGGAEEVRQRAHEAIRAEEERWKPAIEYLQKAGEARNGAVRSLQAHLQSLGYDVTVKAGETRAEVVMISTDFSDTDHRVRFLAVLRKEIVNEATCAAGLTTVRLRAQWWSFNQTYSLDCPAGSDLFPARNIPFPPPSR